MADRTVSVRLQAQVTDYMAKMSAAGKATAGLAHEVDVAKGKAAQGFHAMGVAGVAMGAVVAGGFALAVKSAADFDSKLALVRTLSHATTGEMSQLRDAALTVGQAYGFSAGEVADAEAELIKAGISVSDVIGGALTGALTLAAAGQTDVAAATEIAASAMTQFQLQGKDVPHIADLLAAGADKALGSVTDIGYALDQAGLTAHQFGISIEETVGTLAAFAQAGQAGERGGTVLAQVLAQLSAPSKQAAEILGDLNIHAYDAQGNFVGLASLAGQLQSSMSGLTQAERTHDLQVIFGQRAIRGANILYQEGAEGIRRWTEEVNDNGFAALQAAGKLDSLSGDLTKLKTALQTAFIGVGEGGQSPLRTMVQDLTKAVEVWNGLPGPVKAGAEALVLVGGAVTFAGGAAILFIPKWTAMNAALATTGRTAITARAALTGLGKVGFVGAVLGGVAVGITAVQDALRHPPDVDELTSSLLQLADAGVSSGQLADILGSDFEELGKEVRRLADPGVASRIGDVAESLVTFGQGSSSGLAEARNDIHALDAALAGLVTGGHAETAKKAWEQLSAAAKKQGVSVDTLAHVFPQYGKALTESANSAELAGNGIDQFGNKVGAAGKKTKTATERAKAYSDALHALADPLFGMNQALQGVTDAQHALNVAIRKHGADSPQAKQANLDMASAALEAEAAARTLAASVRDGSVSLHDARTQLREWAADGLITKKSADDVIASFDFLIGRAQTISGMHPSMKVTADTSQAESALSHLISTISTAINAFFDLDAADGGGAPAAPAAPGQHRTFDPNNPTSPPTASPGRRGGGGGGRTSGGGTGSGITYVPTGSGGAGGGGGGGGRAGRTHERPPTVQEIVQAILNGTIPPSIDELSKALQKEIRHLSSTVSNAQQYRSTVRSSLLGYASLSNATAPTDAYGRQMGAVKVNSYLKGRLSQLKQFVHLRHRLEKQGAGQALLHEFEEIGPDANPMMRQLLQGGRSAVRHANRLEHRIHHLSGDAASDAAMDRFGTQLVHEIAKLPPHVARAVVKGMNHADLHISLRQVARARGRNVRSKS